MGLGLVGCGKPIQQPIFVDMEARNICGRGGPPVQSSARQASSRNNECNPFKRYVHFSQKGTSILRIIPITNPRAAIRYMVSCHIITIQIMQPKSHKPQPKSIGSGRVWRQPETRPVCSQIGEEILKTPRLSLSLSIFPFIFFHFFESVSSTPSHLK